VTWPLAVKLVIGLAWPVVVLVLVLVFRRQIVKLLSDARRVKAGPFEIEKERVRADVEAATAVSESIDPDPADGEPSAPVNGASRDAETGFIMLRPEFARIAKLSPEAAVTDAYRELERALRTKLAGWPDVFTVNLDRMSGNQLAALAAREGFISEEAAESVRGLSVLRNLSAHGRADELDEAQALDYLALVDATLYALNKLGPSWKPKRAL